MNCEQIGDLLPDYLQNALTAEQSTQVEQHCEHCANCAQDVTMWKKLALLPPEQPSPDSRARFEAMLHAYPATPSERTTDRSGRRPFTLRFEGWRALFATLAPPRAFFDWLRSPLGAAAWSVALLIIGVVVGTRMNTGTRVNHPAAPSQSEELSAMHAELTNMRQLVALSMLQQQSASERLQGVSWSGNEAHLDPLVQAVLLRTLRYDNSVDVRLAALDALSRHAGQPLIRQGVVDALQEQQSPLVQVALIDQLTEWRDPDAAQRLRNFQQTPNLNPAVRQRAEWAISKLQ
jgi:anti-sigma factor RsiW